MFKRSSFCANEIDIFEAAVKWSGKNNDAEILLNDDNTFLEKEKKNLLHC